MRERRSRSRVPALLLALVVLFSVFIAPSALGEENAIAADEAVETSADTEAPAEEPGEEPAEDPIEEPVEEPAEEEVPAESPGVEETVEEPVQVEVAEESTATPSRVSDAKSAGGKTETAAEIQGGGNNGTVKVDGEDIDAGGGNEPHTDCIFQLDFYGFDQGDSATYTFSLKSPTGSGDLTSDTVPFAAPGPGGLNASTGDIDLGQYIGAMNPIPSPTKGGEYHVRLDVSTPDGNKHKTYWARGCIADIGVTKTDSLDPVQTGSAFFYTVTVTNNGPTEARNVVVDDLLPAGVTFVSAVESVGTYNDATGKWTIGTLDFPGSATLRINVTAGNTAQTVNNTATVSSTTFDQNPNNNQDTEPTTIVDPGPGSADLQVEKTDSADPVMVGDAFFYTITVTNNGPDAADDVTVADNLPLLVDEDTNIASTATLGTLTILNDEIIWTVGDLAKDQSESATIYVVANGVGVASNTATAGSLTPDPDPSNNEDTEPTTIDDVPPPCPNGYTLTTNVKPKLVGNAIDGKGTNPHAAGTSVALQADAPEGWRFDGWSGDGTGKTVRSVTFNGADCTREVTATFAEVKPLPPIEPPDPEDPKEEPPAKKRPAVLGRTLPFTGAQLLTYMWLAMMLMVGGAGAFVAARKGLDGGSEETTE